MKCLFFLPFALLFLSLKVSSQNPNMFVFGIKYCADDTSPACHVMDIYNQAGQIVSNNLILTKQIIVDIRVETREDETVYAKTFSQQSQYNNDVANGVIRMYPTALLKQLDPNFSYTGEDMIIIVNSYFDDEFLYARDNPIEEDQVDFLEIILHELQHGLGVNSNWIDQQNKDLFPSFNYDMDHKGAVTFYHFEETVFDKYLIPLTDSNEHITDYTQALNELAGPSGTIYNSIDGFYNDLRDKQNAKGRVYTEEMFTLAESRQRLGFLPPINNNPAVITLDTEYPFVLGKNIAHFSSRIYSQTADFLLIPVQAPGKKLEEKVDAYGKQPGGGMGPLLRSMLVGMGYQSRIP